MVRWLIIVVAAHNPLLRTRKFIVTVCSVICWLVSYRIIITLTPTLVLNVTIALQFHLLHDNTNESVKFGSLCKHDYVTTTLLFLHYRLNNEVKSQVQDDTV